MYSQPHSLVTSAIQLHCNLGNPGLVSDNLHNSYEDISFANKVTLLFGSLVPSARVHLCRKTLMEENTDNLSLYQWSCQRSSKKRKIGYFQTNYIGHI